MGAFTDKGCSPIEAICTELRRKYPMWSDKKIMAEARLIHSRRGGK